MLTSLLAQAKHLLARETSGQRFIPAIDGLRFIAIMSVVLYHLRDYVAVKTGREDFTDILSAFLKQGYIGVPLFFCISGFIVALPFLQGYSPKFWDYLRRRLMRLEPPYLINLCLLFVLLIVVLRQNPLALLPHLIASIAYIHNVVFGEMSEINFVAWSLEVEFQFYVLVPLLFLMLNRLNRNLCQFVLLSVVVLGGFAYQYIGELAPILRHTLLANFGFFSAGILVAHVYVNNWKNKPEQSVFWDAVTLLLWLFTLLCLTLNLDLRPWMPLIIMAIFFSTLQAPTWSRFLSWPPIFLIGGMCYSIYLYHFQIISAIGRLLLPYLDAGRPLWQDLMLSTIVIVPMIILTSSALFILFEKPFMRKRFISTQRGIS